MMELASAAFCYYVEANPEEWRCPASNYAVFNEAGLQVGTLLGSRYVLHGPEVEPDHKAYLAILRDDNTLLTHTHQLFGRLDGRYIKTETGQRVVLVELNRQFSGVIRTRIDDPYQYRTIIEAATLALESGDLAQYIKLWLFNLGNEDAPGHADDRAVLKRKPTACQPCRPSACAPCLRRT